VATGTGLSYQWKKNGVDIGGATSNTYTVASVTSTDGGNYTVVVTSSGVCVPNNVTSTVAEVIIQLNPVISVQPNSKVICEATSTIFSVSASGTNITYKWRENGIDLTDTGIYSGTSTSSLQLANVPSSINGNLYDVVITGSCGTINSSQVTLTVNPLPVGINDAISTCSDISLSYDLQLNINNGNSVPSTFIWYSNDNVNVTGEKPGIQSTSIISDKLTNITANPEVVTYTITPTSITGSCTGSSITLNVAVNPEPKGWNDTKAICSDVSVNYDLQTQNVDLTGFGGNAIPSSFQWTASDNVNVSGESLTTQNGNIINDVLINSSNVNQVVVYTITPISLANGCAGDTFTVSITVYPTPTFTTVNANPTICSESQTDITLNTPVTGAIVRLKSVNYNGATGTLSPGFTFTNGQKITELLINNTTSTITVSYEFEAVVGSCSPSASQFVNVDVNPIPTITNTSLQLQNSICSGSTLNFSPISDLDPSTTFTWTSSISGSISGISANGSGSIMDTPVNTSNTTGYVTYTITPTANGCTGNSVNYVVTVYPVPTADGTDITICSGQEADISINAGPNNVAGTTFSWVAFPSPNVVGAIDGNGSTIKQILSLSDYSVGTVTYQVTPSVNGCSGSAKNIIVTINPVAVVDAGSDYQVCETTTIPITGTIGGAATSGTWVIVSGAGSISSSVVSGTNVSATYTVDPTDIGNTIVLRLDSNDPDLAGPCSLASDLLNIQINRKPIITLAADYVICEPSDFLTSPINLSGTIGGSATTAIWSVVSGNGSLSASNLSGSTVSAQYIISASDVNTTLTFRLTSNDPDGPTGPCTAEFKDINITINQAAVVNAGPDLQICQDNPSILIQGSQSGASSSVIWSGGVGTFDNTSITQPTYSFAASEINTNVVLTITALDPDGTGPCTNVSEQMNLKINPLPTVIFSGLPSGSPPQIVENNPVITLTGNQVGGLFTIAPSTSFIGGTFVNVVDRVLFDPSVVELGANFITYTYTDANSCTNSVSQEVFVNPVTNIDFAVQGAVVNTDGEFELCADLGLVKLLGFPPAADGFPPETQFTSEGPNAAGLVIVKVGADYFIQTDGVNSDFYRIRYTFKNEFGGITFKEKTIKIFASPVASFTSFNNCIISDVLFTDTSIINPSPFPTTIISWQWLFGDNDFSTDQNPSKRYLKSGTYPVTLKVTTLQGCSNTSSPYALRVGDQPTVDFNWSAICNNDLTKFNDKTNTGAVSVIDTLTWDFGDGFVLKGSANDAVPVGTHGGATTGTYLNPDHKFSVYGNYKTKLTILTNDGCKSDSTKQVFILPYNTIAPVAGSEYLEDFELNGGGWVPEAFDASNSTLTNIIKSDTSWIYGIPNGLVINASSGSTNAWWTGLNNGSYFANENSVINGPCFDLTQLSRPMVALDYFSDAENNLDGAALQYSTDGGLSWIIVGPPPGQLDRDEGINWFNGSGIFSNPGRQPIGNYGWTDRQLEWKNARFNLDMIPRADRSQVRLRIAFSSNDGNAAAFDGFAFDNFFVGEKKRNVLVEHFTTYKLNASIAADTYLNDLYDNQFTIDRFESDFYSIQYHVNFAGLDLLNRDNPTDPAAKALYYGVSQPPYSVMDGLYVPEKFTGITTQLSKIELDRRALVEPQLELTLDTISTNNSRTISVELTMKATIPINVPLVAQVALLEEEVLVNNVGTFRNVLRKHLFGNDGETISIPLVVGQSLVKSVSDIEIDVPISDPSKLVLVGLVQDKNSREVYQSIVIKAPAKNGSPIVGIIDEENKLESILTSIEVFPNPANQQFNFSLPEGNFKGSSWQIIDQRGVKVMNGNFDRAANGLLEVEIAHLPNEMYYIIITGQDGNTTIRKKLMIMNKN
jgi:hypothetical protein